MTKYNHIEELTQKIIDIFFERGATVSMKEYEKVSEVLQEQEKRYIYGTLEVK